MIHESTMGTAPASHHEPDWGRFEVYQRCFNSITAWLDHFFSMTLEMYTRVPFITKDPVWDSAATRNVVDLMTTADRVIQLLEQLKTVIPPRSSDNGDEDGGVSYGVTKLHHLKMAWKNEMESMSQEDYTMRSPRVSDGAHEAFPMLSLDYFDSDVLPDMISFSWQ
jgi:hypothetical protein